MYLYMQCRQKIYGPMPQSLLSLNAAERIRPRQQPRVCFPLESTLDFMYYTVIDCSLHNCSLQLQRTYQAPSLTHKHHTQYIETA